MRKIIFILFCSLILSVPASFAACPPDCPPHYLPVQSIALTYDLNKGVLHVNAPHHSDNWSVDYVRMMTVSLNGQEVSTTNYDHQSSAEGFSDDVQVAAKEGDVITVALDTTGSGSKSQDLTVTKESPAPDQGADNAAN